MESNVLNRVPCRGVNAAGIYRVIHIENVKQKVILTQKDVELMKEGKTLKIWTKNNDFIYIKVGSIEETKARHCIKLYEVYADDVLNGRKTFEVRKNDRDYRKGDKIIFTVVDNMGENEVPHALTGIEYEITYVIEDVLGLQEGYAVLGIRRDDPVEDAAAPNDR